MSELDLTTFHKNTAQRESLKAFMIETLKNIAVTKAFAGESVLGIPEARLLIDKLFIELDKISSK